MRTANLSGRLVVVTGDAGHEIAAVPGRQLATGRE
jgi:hypothetical protein